MSTARTNQIYRISVDWHKCGAWMRDRGRLRDACQWAIHDLNSGESGWLAGVFPLIHACMASLRMHYDTPRGDKKKKPVRLQSEDLICLRKNHSDFPSVTNQGHTHTHTHTANTDFHSLSACSCVCVCLCLSLFLTHTCWIHTSRPHKAEDHCHAAHDATRAKRQADSPLPPACWSLERGREGEGEGDGWGSGASSPAAQSHLMPRTVQDGNVCRSPPLISQK